MAQVEVSLTSNIDQIRAATAEAIETALKTVGMQAQAHVGEEITAQGAIDTGRLRNSIDFEVDGDTVYVGTNVEYAPYVEFGTGVYAENGGGRPTPWAWQDADGNWHRTIGMKPRPYLRPGIEKNISEYQQIFAEELARLGN